VVGGLAVQIRVVAPSQPNDALDVTDDLFVKAEAGR
jgi:hypothetical protein